MVKFTAPLIALLLGGAIALPAAADDFFMPGSSPLDIAQPFHARESARIWGLSLEASQRNQRSNSRTSNRSKPINRSTSTNRTPTSPIELSYSPSQAVKQKVERDYIERMRRKNPAAADQLAAQLRQYDYRQIYANLVRPFGLSDNNLADIFTAYSILNWMIANQANDPSPQSVLAELDRTITTFSKNRSLRDPQVRQQIGEEMKLLFVTLHSGWKSAEREGQLRQYSEGVAALFRQQSGADLRRIVLTSKGFEPRQ